MNEKLAFPISGSADSPFDFFLEVKTKTDFGLTWGKFLKEDEREEIKTHSF